MSWTTFANLTNPTLPELDGNFNILSALVPIPCTVAGTNTLTLTSAEGAGTVSAYAQNMAFIGIAANTNTGATTANPLGFGALSVYKDTIGGPVALTGGEIVQNCAFTLRYDSTLNGSAGGFHLQTSGAGQFAGQTLSVTSVLSTTASLTGLFSGTSMNVTGIGTFGTVSGTALTLTGALTGVTASLAGLFSGVTASLTGLLSGTSLGIGGNNALVRLNSAQYTLSQFTIAFGAINLQTITLAGVTVNDAIQVTRVLGSSQGALYLSGVPIASGSISISSTNIVTNTTLVLAPVIRVASTGFVT